MDTGDAVAAIALITAGVSAIGAAKLLPAATSVGWKWLKAAIFS